MHEISRFYGIVIQMYYGDHAPPHFHVSYNGLTAKFKIETLSWLDEKIPPRARALVEEWAKLHQKELLQAFRMATSLKVPQNIDPLP